MASPRNEYGLRAYGTMIADRARTEAYRAALARVIKPGAIVLDIGAGTGILSFLACQLGAGKVYAVEPGDARAVGVELARANGFADRIEFVPGTSFDLELPQRADVIVGDLRGVLPLHRQIVDTLADARRRLLAPGGVLVPREDTIHMQLLSDADLYAETVHVWRPDVFGLDLSAARRFALNQLRKVDASGSRRIGDPAVFARLDYRAIESPHVATSAEWRVPDPVDVHGLVLWFDSVLADGVALSNAPDQPRKVYGQMLFPFAQALALESGDAVRVRVEAHLLRGEYLWRWDTTVTDAAGRVRTALRQSTFESQPFDPRKLRGREASATCELGREGHAAAQALAGLAEGRTLAVIAASLERNFADLFGKPGRAHEFAADLAEQYGRKSRGP